jgi:hypothetical protein
MQSDPAEKEADQLGEKATSDSDDILRVAKIAGAVVFIIWIANLVIGLISLCSDGKGAELGDSFGIVNALFSGLAFAGVIAALWMQREELSLQRKELRDTREEFAKQTAIQDEHLRLLQEERAERERVRTDDAKPRLMPRRIEKFSPTVKSISKY